MEKLSEGHSRLELSHTNPRRRDSLSKEGNLGKLAAQTPWKKGCRTPDSRSRNILEVSQTDPRKKTIRSLNQREEALDLRDEGTVGYVVRNSINETPSRGILL